MSLLPVPDSHFELFDIFFNSFKCPSTLVYNDDFLDSSKIRNTSGKLILSSLTTLDINILAEAVPM
jgi:hypothetical protein